MFPLFPDVPKEIECPHCHRWLSLDEDWSFWDVLQIAVLFASACAVFIWACDFILDYQHRSFSTYAKDSWDMLVLFIRRLK